MRLMLDIVLYFHALWKEMFIPSTFEGDKWVKHYHAIYTGIDSIECDRWVKENYHSIYIVKEGWN